MKIRRTLLTAFALVIVCAATRAAESWKPLWDGKTLDGWHVIGKGEWKVSDGAIRGTHAKEEKEFSHLVTDKVYRDFTVRLKYWFFREWRGIFHGASWRPPQWNQTAVLKRSRLR